MIIRTLKVISVTQWVEVTISFDKKEWQLSVIAKNGIIEGDHNSVSTAQLVYHNYSDKSRRQNFNEIKKSVEALLASKRQVNPQLIKRKHKS